MAHPEPARRRLWDDPRIVFPDEATWSRLSPREREAVVDAILAVEREYLETMGEGVRHFRNKSGIGAILDGHFRRAKRSVFVACELPVFYPAEAMIVPDVLAVVDCDPDIEPDSWIVADEKRGIDLVVEVRNLGRKHKDLVENVRDYARLRIPEYFSFDCRSGHLRGFRLGASEPPAYRPIVPQGGCLRSQVLGLDLAVVDLRLRFFADGSMVPDAAELVARLESMANQRLTALEEAEREREEAEREREEAEREREEAEREREEALAVLSRMQVTLARAVLDACAVRGIPLGDADHARVVAEADVDVLGRWVERAFHVTSAAELFAEHTPIGR
jgi:Uma2 family endonuclease